MDYENRLEEVTAFAADNNIDVRLERLSDCLVLVENHVAEAEHVEAKAAAGHVEKV